MAEGNPHCEICHGRGGTRGPYGWLRCPCTRPTKEQARLQRRMNSIGAKNPDGRAVRQALAQLELGEVVESEPLQAVMDIIERALRTNGVGVIERKDRAILISTSKGKHMVGVNRCL